MFAMVLVRKNLVGVNLSSHYVDPGNKPRSSVLVEVPRLQSRLASPISLFSLNVTLHYVDQEI